MGWFGRKGERELVAALWERGLWAGRLGGGPSGFPGLLGFQDDHALLVAMAVASPRRRVGAMIRPGRRELFRHLEGRGNSVFFCAYDPASGLYSVYSTQILLFTLHNQPGIRLGEIDVTAEGDVDEVADYFQEWMTYF